MSVETRLLEWKDGTNLLALNRHLLQIEKEEWGTWGD